MPKTFLKAEWKKLLMINYPVDKKLLDPYIPYKTELDLWNNTCYVSLIGFMFLNTKVKKLKIPFHINFEEVNLRFYVKHKDMVKNEWKRGVVFIKEIVSKPALTFIANSLYKENYETLPTSHKWIIENDRLSIEYSWEKSNSHNSIKIVTGTELFDIENGSEEEFITEHYWGYTRINENMTSEYGVEHPRWKIYKTLDYEINVNFENTYPKEFGFLDSVNPASVFLAEGSEIEVKEGREI